MIKRTSILTYLICQFISASVWAQSVSNPGERFESGEIIIGYKSKELREQAIQELKSTKDNVHVRGQSAENLQVQAVGNTSLKLRFAIPAEVRGDAARDPSIELKVLKEVASEIKKDGRVRFAHPNWILELRPSIELNAALPKSFGSRRSRSNLEEKQLLVSSIINDFLDRSGPLDCQYVHLSRRIKEEFD